MGLYLDPSEHALVQAWLTKHPRFVMHFWTAIDSTKGVPSTQYMPSLVALRGQRASDAARHGDGAILCCVTASKSPASWRSRS